MKTMKIKNKENPKDFRGKANQKICVDLKTFGFQTFENVKHFQTFQASIFFEGRK